MPPNQTMKDRRSAFGGCIGDGTIAIDGAGVTAETGNATLAVSGHPLPTADGLASAYRRHGMDLPAHLDGHYALVIHDLDSEPRWLLARDPSGSVPLYYVTGNDGDVCFSDTITPLLSRLPEVALNPDALVDFLTHFWSLDGKTFFRGVHLAPAGYGITPNGGKRFFTFEHAESAAGDSSNEDELQAMFLELFAQCVRDSLGPALGCHVSGGVDSSAVAVAASGMTDGPLPVFGTAFPAYAQFDESPYAEQLAESIGAEWHPVGVAADDFSEVFPNVVRTLEEPKCHPPVLARYLLERASEAAGCRTILTGRGADELFTGYDSHRRESLDRPRERRTVFTAAERRSLLNFRPDYDVEAEFERVFDGCRGGTALEQVLAFDVQTLMANWMIVDYKISSRFGARCTAPFLDPRMIRFALGIPVEKKCAHDTPKVLLKSWLADTLPEALLTRPKVGFRTPMGEMMRDGLESVVRDRLSPGTGAFWDWFEPKAVSALVDTHFSGERNLGWQLWALLCVREWAEVYLDRREWVP